MIWNEGVLGISETHVINVATFANALPQFLQLFKARTRMMGPPVVVFKGRMSKIGQRRAFQLLTSTQLKDIGVPTSIQLGSNTGTVGPSTADQPKSCALAQFDAGEDHHRNLYLAGIPDAVIREDPEGVPFNVLPAWQELFDTYKNILIQNPWGFVGRVTENSALPIKNVIGLALKQDTSELGVVVATADAIIDPFKYLFLTGFRSSNRAYRVPQGKWFIKERVADFPFNAQTTYWLRGALGYVPSQVTTLGQVQQYDVTNRKYTAGELKAQTTRKRGNRFLAGPGRRTLPRFVSQ
jgi:hypothetical protein